MRDVILNMIDPPEHETTLTNLVLEFAKIASSEEWIDMFDVLIGTLIGLLHRFVISLSYVSRGAFFKHPGNELGTNL